MIPVEELDTLVSTITEAGCLAAQSKVAEGYECLLEGICRLEDLRAVGEPWLEPLVGLHRLALERYTGRLRAAARRCYRLAAETIHEGGLLLVEDDPELRDPLAERLRAAGLSVAIAAHGQAALDYLRHYPRPALILLDLEMPVMGGAEFRELQLQDPRLLSVPVILMAERREIYPPHPFVHADGYLEKPAELPEILRLAGIYCR